MSNQKRSAMRVAQGRAYAKANQSHFAKWCLSSGFTVSAANRKVFQKYGVELFRLGLVKGIKAVKAVKRTVPLTLPVLKLSAPSTLMQRKEGSLSTPASRPSVNLTMACPTTGFVKLRCGCVRCGNARKSNGRVR